MKFHKLAELFPLLEGNELKALAQDIAENGLREPIITYHDEILDGRNRYRACEIAKVKPTFRKYEGSNLLDFVLSANLHRRHLNESQRAMIAAKVENLEHGGNRKSNQDANLHLEKVSRVQAAEMLNVSPRLVADAVAIRNSGNEILLKKIATGEMTIHRAITESERHENIRKLNDIKNQEKKK